MDFLRILRKSPTCEAICVSENLFLVHRKMESWTFDNISEKSPRNEDILACICWTICDTAVKTPTNSKICMKTGSAKVEIKRNVVEIQ